MKSKEKLLFLNIAFLAVLPMFVGICMVRCQRISKKFKLIFVIMVTFGLIVLLAYVLDQLKLWNSSKQWIGLMVMIVYCLFISIFFITANHTYSSDSNSKCCWVLLHGICCMFLILFIFSFSLSGLMIMVPVSLSVIMLSVLVLLKLKPETKPITKVDFLTEGTKMSQPRPTKVEYPVAISNSLFKDSEIGKDLPCQHCNMITMGEMVCYQEFCPECGRIPPNRKRQEYWFLQAINGPQKLIVSHISYGSSVPDDFPPLVTCMSKNEQEKFRYRRKKFVNVKKSVKFEETEVPHGSDQSSGTKKEEIMQFQNGNSVIMKNVRDCSGLL
jgi:hypothetical protein